MSIKWPEEDPKLEELIDNKDKILKAYIKETRLNLRYLWSLKVVPIKAYRQAMKLFMRLRALNKK